MGQGEFGPARAHYEESLAIRRRLNDRPGTGSALNNLGEVARWQDDLAGARTYYEESLVLAREAKDEYSIALVLGNLGALARVAGRNAEARTLLAAGLRAARTTTSARDVVAQGLEEMAAYTAAEGDALGAARLWGAAEALLSKLPHLSQPFGRVVTSTKCARRGPWRLGRTPSPPPGTRGGR